MARFIISNKDFVKRVLHEQMEEEEPENTELDQSVDDTAASIQEGVNVDENLVITTETTFHSELAKIAEVENIQQPRSIKELGLSKHPSTSMLLMKVEELYEGTLKSAEAVVASRISYINQISDLIRDYDTLANALLLLAEKYSVVFPMRKIDQNSMEIMEVDVPVTREGSFNAHELALISIILRRKMDTFPQTSKELNAKIESLTSASQFKDGQIVALKARLEESVKNKPKTVSVFYIKRQGKERFLSLDGKKIRSFKQLTTNCIFTSRADAEATLIYAIRNQEKTKVKRVLTYEVIQLVHGQAVKSPKIQEAIKNAYK